MRMTLATLASVTAVLAACSDDHVCTLIGADPGVRVTGGVNGASVRVCAGSTCGTTATVNGHGFVNLPSLRPGRKVELRVTYSHGSESKTSVVNVVSDKFRPNGPDCGPSVAAATVTLDADGQIAG